VAVRIRLQRKGARHTAFFRIVAADSRSPRDGRFIEQLGYYDPLRDPPEINVDTEKVIGWLSKGARPSETVTALLRRVGIMQTWHEIRRGKSLDELRHIEDEARKRIDAQAAMDRRKSEEAKARKPEPEGQRRETGVEPTEVESIPEGGGAEQASAEPKVEEAAGEKAKEGEAAAGSGAPDEQASGGQAPDAGDDTSA
jgi:small subunit ribosomal protein S16